MENALPAMEMTMSVIITFEQRLFRMLDDPPPIMNGKRALNCRSREPSRADNAEKLIRGYRNAAAAATNSVKGNGGSSAAAASVRAACFFTCF
jgi:hypothetical protein